MSFSPFDMMYLIYRCRRIKVNIRKLSPLNIVRVFATEKVRISGIQVLDIAEMYRETLHSSKWETLQEISMRELDKSRVFHDESVFEMWDSKKYWKVIARNLRDVELIKLLNNELELLEQFDTLKRTVGCNFRDTFYASRIADIMFLRERHGKEILPSRSMFARYKYLGAKVFKSTKGIHRNLAVFDFREMYPTFMDIFNISYETFREYPEEGEDVVKVYDGHYFLKYPKGYTEIILDKIRPIRAKVKTRMKKISPLKPEYKRLKAKSDAYKSIINAVYGFYGFGGNIEKGIPSSRLYAPKIAEAITYPGRTLLEFGLTPIIEKIGYVLIYGDTDSIFIQLKTNNLKKESEELREKLDKEIKKFVIKKWNVNPEELVLEIDKIVVKAIMFTKKRYVLKTIEGEIITKGLEMVRRESSKITIDLQERMTDMALNDIPKEEIEEYLSNQLKEFRNKPLTEIALSPKLSKPVNQFKTFSKHLQAFLYSKNELNIDLKLGSRFYMVYIKSLPINYSRYVYAEIKGKKRKRKMDVIGFTDIKQIPKGTEIDYEVMIEKTVRKKVEDLLDVLDIDWNKIYAPFKSQKTLFNYY